MKKLPRFLLAVATAALVTAGPAVAANADTASGDTSGSYCAMQLQPAGSDTPETEPTCFDTNAELQSYLSSVGVKTTTTTTSTSKTRALSAATAADDDEGTAVLIGEVFQDVYYGGARMAFWGTTGCADGEVYGWPTLSPAWTNSISSGHGNDTCYLQMYPLQNYQDDGMKITCSWECITMSTMNDRTQSLRFTPWGVFG